MESIDDVVNDATKNAVHLNGSKRKILALIAEGMSNKQIAESLTFKEKTIEAYVGEITATLGARRRLLTTVAVRCVILQNMEYKPPFKLEELQLTPRLTEILYLVGTGRANTEIAAELGIAPKTVEGRINQLKDSLPIENSSSNRRFWAYAAWKTAHAYKSWCAARPKIA